MPSFADTRLDIDAATRSSEELVQALARRGEIRRYRRGTILIEEGDRGSTLYVVLEGSLRVYSASPSGRELTFGVYGPGEYVGEMSLDGGVRAASVITAEPSVCAVVTRETIRDFIRQHPEFAFELLTKVIRRARAATVSARNLALNDVYGRLRLELQAMAEPREDGTHAVRPRPTHQQLAHRVGCVREMVSKILKDLSQGEYIRVERGCIVIRRPLPVRW